MAGEAAIFGVVRECGGVWSVDYTECAACVILPLLSYWLLFP